MQRTYTHQLRECVDSTLLVREWEKALVDQKMAPNSIQYFEIALASTLVYIGLVAVGVKFFQIGTLAGALGRAFLAMLIVLLARWSLHHTISAHATAAMGKAILLALGSGLPLLLLDQFFLRVDSFGLRPVFQLAILAGLFVVAFAF